MNKLMVLVGMLMLVGCGDSGTVFVTQKSCTVTPNMNGSFISCPDGTTAQVNNGLAGPAGLNGTNATPVTVVNLCNGVTTYPNTFVEVALCINGGLYAVYSINNGFLTYLPNGAYSSNGLGSACNLVVNGCSVTH